VSPPIGTIEPSGALVAVSAADEWSTLVATAVVGTDRHPLPPAALGWDVWGTHPDPAVALLDRAAAVVAARRAGVLASPSLPTPPLAPSDHRPVCSPACVVRLRRLLDGEHDLLLAEWLHLCLASGDRPPWSLLPTLLLRARRNADLDLLVRHLAGDRARWLAEALPELGVRPTPKPAGAVVIPPPPARVPDSGATVSVIVQTFHDQAATWAAAPQLRLLVVSLEPRWLAALIAELSGLRFDAHSERTRADLLALAEFRDAMVRDFDARPSDGSHGRFLGERVYGDHHE
jgi:hypothetical protein